MDRAITWTLGRPDGFGGGPDIGRVFLQGAVVYLDSGRVARLPAEEAGFDWLADFELVSTEYVANDRRQYLIIEYSDGAAHTHRIAVVGLGADGDLRFVRLENGEAFSISLDYSVSSGGGYGCYSRDGRGRLADWYWARSGGDVRNLSRVVGKLRVSPYEINNLVATKMGDDLLYSTPGHPNLVDHAVGRACDERDPGARGAYGVHVPGVMALTERDAQAQALARSAIRAILAGNVPAMRESFVSQAMPRAIDMAGIMSGAGELKPGLTCAWDRQTLASGLEEEGSCWAEFEIGAWIGVGIGRDADGRFRAVDARMTAD